MKDCEGRRGGGPKTRPLDTRLRPNPGVFPDIRQEHSQRKISRGIMNFKEEFQSEKLTKNWRKIFIEFGEKYSPMVPIGI